MFPLKILIADDHRLFRQGLVGIMRTRPDLVGVVGEASTGDEAISLARQHSPDIVLMDIYMPNGNGLDAARVICQEMPKSAIIMLTASDLDEHLHEAVRLGAAGYLLKDLDATELFELITGVARGEAALTRAMAARLLKSIAVHNAPPSQQADSLTDREIQVLRLVAQGATNPQIAESLCITVNTVKVHIRNILSKLQLENRTQVAAFATKSGWLKPPSVHNTENNPSG